MPGGLLIEAQGDRERMARLNRFVSRD